MRNQAMNKIYFSSDYKWESGGEELSVIIIKVHVNSENLFQWLPLVE